MCSPTGGSAFAAAKIGSAQIKNNSIKSTDVKNNQVTGQDVKNRSLTDTDFKAGSLPTGARGAPGPPGPPGRAPNVSPFGCPPGYQVEVSSATPRTAITGFYATFA